MVVWRNGKLLNPMEILVDDTNHSVISEEAMAVNKIDLAAHSHLSVSLDTAKADFFGYLSDNLSSTRRIVVGGHNVAFDIGFLRAGVISPDEWEDRFQHRVVDTSVILRFLYHSGILRSDVGSLDNALKFFGFPEVEGRRHTAMGDAVDTAKLYNRLLQRVVTNVRGS